MKKKLFNIFLAVIIFITAIFIGVKHYYPTKYNSYVKKYSKQYNLDKNLVFAIIKTESNFNKNAISKKGAVGLMQIMPSTAKYISKELKVENYSLNNPNDNIKFGCFYLNYLFSKFNNEKLVIYAYNAGEGNLKKYLLGQALPKETINYYIKITRAKKIYKLM